MDALSERWLGHKPIAFAEVAGSGTQFHRLRARRRSTRRPQYAAEDADVTLRLWRVLKPRLVAEGMTHGLRDAGAAAGRCRWRAWSSAASRSTATCCRGCRANSRRAWRGSRRRSTKLVGAPFNLGSPKQLGDILFGQMGLPGGKKTATGAWSTSASVLEDLAEEGHELPRAHPRLAPALQAEIDLYRRAAGLRQSAHAAASTPPTRWPRRRPGGCRRPSPTCRTSRCATRKGRKIRRAFVAAPGHKLISADYSQIELRLLAHIADIAALKTGLRRRARHPRDDRVGDVRRAGQGHAGRDAPPRQGDQLRHHLRHLGLRPRQPARHPARGGGRLHQANISSASPASATTWRRPRSAARADGYRDAPCSAASAISRASTPPTRRERAFNERAAINAPIQGSAADIIRRAMIAHGRRRSRGRSSTRACCCRCTTNWCSRRPTTRSRRRSRWCAKVMVEAPEPARARSASRCGRRARRGATGTRRIESSDRHCERQRSNPDYAAAAEPQVWIASLCSQ